MRRSGILMLVGALVAVASACGTEPPDYGPSTAGPTRTSTPAAAPDATAAAEAPPAPPRTDDSLCDLYSTKEISKVLGLDVAEVETSRRGPFVVCSWLAKDEPRVPAWRVGDPVLEFDGGIVTITRGRAPDYADLEREVTAAARSKNADARQQLPGVGLQAFAIGSSVSGVPIWQAVAVHDGVVTAVEVSGADSRAGVVTVKDFLSLVVARG